MPCNSRENLKDINISTMKSFVKLSAILLIASVLDSCVSKHETEQAKLSLSGEWLIKSSVVAKESGEIISTDKYTPQAWYPAQVPTTVLNALIKDKVYPDPWIGLNNYKIPDVSDEFNKKYDLAKYSYIDGNTNPWKDPYWFRKEFKIPESYTGKQLWLNFDGINYRADVWLNGHMIAGQKEMVGMFLRFRYDITQYALVNQANYLAVKVYQVDHPGIPSPGVQFEVFGKTRGHAVDIFKDETLKFTGGWDCAPVIRDRNMGIYQDVFITATGPVSIENPFIGTTLPLPDTSHADLKITADLKNSLKTEIAGLLTIKISLDDTVKFPTYNKIMGGAMKDIVFSTPVKLGPGQDLHVSLNPSEFPLLTIQNPYLWWPNGYGKQYLHNLKLVFEIDGKVSDIKNTTFGIREITSTFKEINGDFGRIFRVNGQRIFCRGGWIQPDMMLDMNEKRMYNEGRLMADANVNMIGTEDMPSPPDQVMDVYDKYGLLIWETFYQCWTSYPGTNSFVNPLDTKLSLKNSYDIVKRYRNHPSLVLWAIANESLVREEIYVPLREYIKRFDPTRPFVATSSYGWDVDKLTPYMKPDLPTGTTDEGLPDYTWYPHPYYYNMVLEVKQQMFRNEMGVPAISTLASMKKYIFDLGKGTKNDIYPLDKKWAYHDAWDGDGYAFKAYDHAIREEFGQPSTAEEYIRNAQYVNAGSYRAMYEAANHRMWDITSGVMIWKLNATWPQVLWQIYDWFLNPNAGYFYAKKAMEPLHIQLNENDFTVSV